MNKKLLNYTLVGLSVAIGSFAIIKLISTDKIQTGTTESAKETIEVKPVVQPIPTPEQSITLSPEAEPEDEHDKHGSEFYTEIMPKVKADTPATFSPPKTDNEKLGYILDAEFAPVHDDTGTFTGLKISSLPEAILTAPAMKIQNGDIITQINGVKMANEESFGVAIEQLLNTGEAEGVITFDVERNGASYSVSLAVQL